MRTFEHGDVVEVDVQRHCVIMLTWCIAFSILYLLRRQAQNQNFATTKPLNRILATAWQFSISSSVALKGAYRQTGRIVAKRDNSCHVIVVVYEFCLSYDSLPALLWHFCSFGYDMGEIVTCHRHVMGCATHDSACRTCQLTDFAGHQLKTSVQGKSPGWFITAGKKNSAQLPCIMAC